MAAEHFILRALYKLNLPLRILRVLRVIKHDTWYVSKNYETLKTTNRTTLKNRCRCSFTAYEYTRTIALMFSTCGNLLQKERRDDKV